MSIVKQIVAVVLFLGLVGAGFVAYEHFVEGQAATSDGQTPSAVAGAPVRLSTATLGHSERRVEAVGSTNALRAVDIVPLASGRIVELTFEPGQRVEAGAVLARLDDDIQRANLAEAEAGLTEARQALERGRTLRQRNTVAEASVETLIAREATAQAALDRARRQLTDREIAAPFEGIVGLKRVEVGGRVEDGTVITTLDDLSEVELEFALPETLYGQVRHGLTVFATSAAFSGRDFEGRVSNIDSRIDRTSRAFRVRARLPNPDLALPAGMFMLLSVVIDEREAVKVPEEAIVAEGDRTFVFVAENGRAVRRDVRLGQREVGSVEIVEGVSEGERVVTQGTMRLRDGAPIHAVGEAAEEGEAPGAGAGPV